MAPSTSPLLLDRIPFWLIAAINPGANFLFGALCGVLDTHRPGHGLNPPRVGEVIQHFLNKYLTHLPEIPGPGSSASHFPPRK